MFLADGCLYKQATRIQQEGRIMEAMIGAIGGVFVGLLIVLFGEY